MAQGPIPAVSSKQKALFSILNHLYEIERKLALWGEIPW